MSNATSTQGQEAAVHTFIITMDNGATFCSQSISLIHLTLWLSDMLRSMDQDEIVSVNQYRAGVLVSSERPTAEGWIAL